MTNDALSRELARLAAVVERMTLPIPQIPAIPAIPPLPQYTGDHDLLVKLDTKVEGLVIAVKGLTTINDSDNHKEEDIKRHAEEDKILNDHETRIRAQDIHMENLRTEIKVIKSQFRTWGIALGVFVSLIQVALHFVK